MKTVVKSNNLLSRFALIVLFIGINSVTTFAQNKQTFDTRGNTGAQQIGALIDQYYYIAEIVCALYVVGTLISIAYKILGEQQQANFKMFMNPLIAIGLIFFIIPAIINAVFG